MPEIITTPATHSAPYNKVVFKASHNSYVREEQPITTQIPFDTEEPHQCGCRGLELDIRPNDDVSAWSVGHGGGYEADEEKQLTHYLKILGDWSKENPDHDIITVHLDLKGVPADIDAFPAAFDAYMSDAMDRDRVFRASDLLAEHEAPERGKNDQRAEREAAAIHPRHDGRRLKIDEEITHRVGVLRTGDGLDKGAEIVEERRGDEREAQKETERPAREAAGR